MSSNTEFMAVFYMFSILYQDAHMLPCGHWAVLLYMKWGNFTAGKTGCKTSEAFLYLLHLLLQQMGFRLEALTVEICTET